MTTYLLFTLVVTFFPFAIPLCHVLMDAANVLRARLVGTARSLAESTAKRVDHDESYNDASSPPHPALC